MGVHYLERMFSPRSVAVYGASDTADSIGHAVFQNILASGYGGDVHAINLRHKKVADLPAVASACCARVSPRRCRAPAILGWR